MGSIGTGGSAISLEFGSTRTFAIRRKGLELLNAASVDRLADGFVKQRPNLSPKSPTDAQMSRSGKVHVRVIPDEPSFEHA